MPARSRPAVVAAAALLGAGLAGCTGGDRTAEVVASFELGAAAGPVALARLSDGRLAVGERLTGRVVAVTPAAPSTAGSAQEPAVVASVDVGPAVAGQRGLLGLAAIGEQLFAAWTRGSDGRLVVGRVSPGPAAVVWEGPPSTDLATGGHLAVGADGRLLIGIGDLQSPDLVEDPDALNGKVISLDPEGPPQQRPLILSGGWHNPVAFTVAGGTIWVADNAPGDRPERIGRGEVGAEAVELPGRRAPSALVALGPERLGLCGFLDGDLVEIDVAGPPAVGAALARGVCRTGAVALGPGSVAVSDGATVRVLALPAG